MSYANARDLFPEDVLKIIQQYVDGEYIYIPRREENKMAWGEISQSKKELLIRNNNIYSDYLSGMSVNMLSQKYYLSPKTIQRIISLKRKYELLNSAT